jgi:uncharacterized membrane protein
MQPVVDLGLLWLVFAGLHVGLATRAVRGFLVTRVGERGFVALFSLLAVSSFAAMVHFYAVHRFDGPPGPGFGTVPIVGKVLVAIVALGVVLAMAGVVVYPGSASALFVRSVRPPSGFERITRHPFFAGVALVASAHALLATHAIGSVFVAGFALLTIVGGLHQDRKLRDRYGRAYDDYVERTSFVPFAAIVGGRQRLAPRELSPLVLLLGAAGAGGLRMAHASLFTYGGAGFIATVVGGAALLSVQSWRRAARVGEQAATPWLRSPASGS